MATSAEQLILRGLNLVIRATYSPNDQVAQAQHFLRLQNDIAPWLKDYAEEIAKPAVDFTITPMTEVERLARYRHDIGTDALKAFDPDVRTEHERFMDGTPAGPVPR